MQSIPPEMMAQLQEQLPPGMSVEQFMQMVMQMQAQEGGGMPPGAMPPGMPQGAGPGAPMQMAPGMPMPNEMQPTGLPQASARIVRVLGRSQMRCWG